MEVLTYDVLIIGGGLAGLRAAAAAHYASAGKLSIAVLTKAAPMRSHSVAAEGGMAAVMYPELTGDSPEQHAVDTIKGGDGLVDQDAALLLALEAPREVEFLEKIGVPWSRGPDGRLALRQFGGMSKPRTVFAKDKTGFYIMTKLISYIKKLENINLFSDIFVIKLIVKGGEFKGAVILDLRSGEAKLFLAKAGVIATGGAGRLYKFTTASYVVTGEMLGYALEAGAALRDMEFVQWHPTALPNGILISEAARAEGGYLINGEGERFMRRYAPDKMELAPRDVVARAIIFEIMQGRGLKEGSGGDYVGLDLRHLPEEKFEERLPLLVHTVKTYLGLDPRYDVIPVRPAVHYTIGGIYADLYGHVLRADGEWIKGLWAAGEAASVGVHGANRLGSNSLSECAVWGRLAGEQAAKYALEAPRPSVDLALLSEARREEGEIYDRLLHSESGGYSVYELVEELRGYMERGAGIIRHGSTLAEALSGIKTLREKSSKIRVEDRGRIYNANLRDVLQFRGMLRAAEAVVLGALLREESRGAHYRADFPTRDDKWAKHTVIHLYGGELRADYAEVKATKWRI